MSGTTFAALMETIEVLSDPQALEMLRDSIADVHAGRLVNHADVEKLLGEEPEHPSGASSSSGQENRQ